MVNAPSTTAERSASPERRDRLRAPATHQGMLGTPKLNPFGDLHTLQHLSARLARSLRGVFEPVLRREVRSWAEPLAVQRFADYRAERGDGLTAWIPMAMTPQASHALLVIDGKFVFELLDLFFGGNGSAPAKLPTEFSPATDALVTRIANGIAIPLAAAWEPVARIGFTPGRADANAAMVAALDGDDPVVVTRFGIASGEAAPVFVDLLYPVTALKPHGTALTGKVVGKSAEPDPAWRTELTRAAMGIRFPVRSVLAEPVVPLQMLVDLKVGDVIPISVGPDVPVMVGRDRLGIGTVGASNGHAAVRLLSLAHHDEGSRP